MGLRMRHVLFLMAVCASVVAMVRLARVSPVCVRPPSHAFAPSVTKANTNTKTEGGGDDHDRG